MPKSHPCSKDDDTRVIYRDKLSELLSEIRTSNLSSEDLDAIEGAVLKIKNRMKAETKQRTKDENRADPDAPLLAGGV